VAGVLCFLLAATIACATTLPPAPPAPARADSTLRFDVLDWELTRLDSTVVRLSDYRGKLVVLDFWGLWCSPCLRWLPRYLEIEKRYAGRDDVVFMTINHELRGAVADQRERILRFMESRQWSFPVLLDTDSTAIRTHGIYAFPTTLVIDRYGRVRYANTSINAQAENSLVAEIEALLR
jgi:thiol-disulfide isomerase/thioredoxin